MDHTVDFAPLARDYGHHESLIPNGDELFLQHAFLAVRAESLSRKPQASQHS